jgi:inosine-uridine nucleoside N-ribohydrolase
VTEVGLLIETDIFSDVDDVGALAVAHALADDGMAAIAAVCVNTPSRWGHQAVQVVNAYYGRPDTPVGALLPLDDSVAEHDYAKHLATSFAETELPDPEHAVRVARRCLHQAADDSIVVVSLGFFHNLVGLLNSAPDDISPLAGSALISRKVRRTVVMGGRFPRGWEFNIGKYPDVAAAFVESWPTDIEFLGWEVGNDVITGRELSLDSSPGNPVSAAYRAFSGAGAGRQSWDLMTVALAVNGVTQEYEYSPPGRVRILDDGATEWIAELGGKHRHVTRIKSAEEIGAALDEYLMRTPLVRRALSLLTTESPLTTESGSPS